MLPVPEGKEYAVYTLRHPYSHKVFYVGMTEDTVRRFTEHLSTNGTNPSKDATILHLRKEGLTPFMQVERTCKGEDKARSVESFLTGYYLAAKHPLTNQEIRLPHSAEKGRKEHASRRQLLYTKIIGLIGIALLYAGGIYQIALHPTLYAPYWPILLIAHNAVLSISLIDCVTYALLLSIPLILRTRFLLGWQKVVVFLLILEWLGITCITNLTAIQPLLPSWTSWLFQS